MKDFFKLIPVFLVLVFSMSSLKAEEPLPSLYELYRGFIINNGGEKNMLELNSIIVSGQIIQDDQKVKFRLYRKRPNKMRLTVSFDNFEISTIFNGEIGWQEVTSRSELVALTKIEGDELALLKTDSMFDSPFYAAFNKRKLITVAAIEEVNGEEAVSLDFDPAGKFGFDSIWLSLENYQEVKMLRGLPNDSGKSELSKEEIYYDRFSLIKGVYWARIMQHFVEGAMTKEVIIEDVKPNAGVFDAYFEVDDVKNPTAR